jgi:capsular exopolysaccharide synthesis family protein
VQVDPHDLANAEEQVFSFDVKRYLEALRKYAWTVVALVAVGITLAVVYTRRQPEIFEAKASVQIEPRLPDLLGQPDDLVARSMVGGQDYYAQQKEVLGSYKLVRETVQTDNLYLRILSEQERGDRPINELIDEATLRVRDGLTIKYPEQNRIMFVVVRDHSAELARDIANAHVKTYLAYSKGLLAGDITGANSVLKTEFNSAETELRDAEAAIYAFEKDNDLLAVTLEERQSIVSTGISAYTMKLNEAKAHHMELASKLDRLRKSANGDVLQSPILLMADTTSFDGLRAQYYAEHNKFKEIQKQMGPKTTEYQMQEAKVDDLYAALQGEAKRMIESVQELLNAQVETENALKAEIDKATKEALELGPKVVSFNELQRKKRSAEDRYNILRQRLATANLNDRLNKNRAYDVSNIKELDAAQLPTVPVAPNIRVNVAVAGALSVLLGLGLVMLVVFLDRSIKNTKDVAQITRTPVVGVIPLLEQLEGDGSDHARDLYVHREPTSPIAECCRALRTNVMFSSADHHLKTLVVSSANPREGKTTSVIYLGTTMAQSGQRVLLVDTDMRRPRLHVPMGVSRETGLTNLIVGDRSCDEVIQKTEIPNLDLVPCGPLPPNPAELLMTQRFAKVLADLAERYDRVILDSPPLNVVTDTVVLSKHVDGTIFVVRAGNTLRDDLRRSERAIRDVGGNIFGLIVNAIEPNSRSYGYGYGSYGYNYSYSYSEKANT